MFDFIVSPFRERCRWPWVESVSPSTLLRLSGYRRDFDSCASPIVIHDLLVLRSPPFE